jgi:hypothetical protein
MADENSGPPTPKRRLLITGIGRSGTGLECGHEAIYTGRTTEPPDWGERYAESSWFAAPWLADLPDQTLVVHVVRNPIDWLASWVGTVWPKDKQTPYTFDYLARVTGVPWRKLHEADALDAGMRIWVLYNGYIERLASRCYSDFGRIEDVTAHTVGAMLQYVGLPVVPKRLMAAHDAVPKNVNTRPHRKLKIAECAFRAWYPELMRAAARYGYDDPWKGRSRT